MSACPISERILELPTLEDDLLDLKNGEEVSDDLKKGRVSLPLIHLYSMSNSLEKKAIDEELWIATKKDDIERDGHQRYH